MNMEQVTFVPGEEEARGALVSIAISLKRIADALEKQNEIALCVTQGFPTGESE